MVTAVGLSAIARSGAEWIALCREAERVGLSSAWSSDVRDGLVDAGLALSHTSALRVGLAIASPTRTPLQMARAAQGLGEWGNRFTLGLGPGHSTDEGAASRRWFRMVGAGAMEDAHGIPFYPPVGRLREYHACVTALLYAPVGEPVDVVGEYFRVSGRGFGFDRMRLPTILGVYGPRMVRLSGEISDGIMIHHVCPRAVIARKAAQARAAHVASGSAAPFYVGFGTLVSAHPDEGVALRVARAELVGAFSVPPYLDRLAEDFPEVVDRLRPLVAAGEYMAAAGAVPEEVVRDLIVVSTPGRLRAQVEVFGCGVDECVLLPVGVFAPLVAEALEVSPAVLAEVRDGMLSGLYDTIPTPAP